MTGTISVNTPGCALILNNTFVYVGVNLCQRPKEVLAKRQLLSGMKQGVNLLYNCLTEDSIKDGETQIVIEDNIGESIHIHYDDLRIEMTVHEFIEFAEEIEQADKKLDYGDC